MKGDIISNYKNVIARIEEVENVLKTKAPNTIEYHYANMYNIPQWYINVNNRLANVDVEKELILNKNKESNLSSNDRKLLVHLYS